MLIRIYNRGNYVKMDLKQFRNSNEFDEFLKECIEQKKLSISWIQKHFHLSFQKASILYKEAMCYNDEVFFHNVMYELSFIEEPPTIARIMGTFGVSFLLASKIFDFYMENC